MHSTRAETIGTYHSNVLYQLNKEFMNVNYFISLVLIVFYAPQLKDFSLLFPFSPFYTFSIDMFLQYTKLRYKRLAREN